KELLRAYQDGDAAAAARFRALASTSPREGEQPKLADALHVIANEYGFGTWMALKAHVEAAAKPFDPFEALKAALRAQDGPAGGGGAAGVAGEDHGAAAGVQLREHGAAGRARQPRDDRRRARRRRRHQREERLVGWRVWCPRQRVSGDGAVSPHPRSAARAGL